MALFSMLCFFFANVTIMLYLYNIIMKVDYLKCQSYTHLDNFLHTTTYYSTKLYASSMLLLQLLYRNPT